MRKVTVLERRRRKEKKTLPIKSTRRCRSVESSAASSFSWTERHNLERARGGAGGRWWGYCRAHKVARFLVVHMFFSFVCLFVFLSLFFSLSKVRATARMGRVCSQLARPPVSRSASQSASQANRQRRVGEPSVKALRVRIQTLMADREQRTRQEGGNCFVEVCVCVRECVCCVWCVSLAWRGSQEATHQGPESEAT